MTSNHIAALWLSLSTASTSLFWTGSSVAAAPTHTSSPASGDLQQTATEVDESLSKIDTEFRDLFGDSSLGNLVHYFTEANSAAAKLVKDGKPVPAEVGKVHNNLDEFIRGLNELEKSAHANSPPRAGEHRAAELPAAKWAKPLRELLLALKEVMNAQEGLKEIGRVKLKDSTSAPDAVEYGNLLLDRVQMVLYSRGLVPISDAEKRETDTRLGPALTALRTSICAMIDSSGARVVQKDEKGERRPDQLFLVRQALADAEKSLDLFKTAFPQVRERTAAAQSDLRTLRENFLKPRALHE